ncbi:hypothetical protein N7537_007212, partial [Penicillium hordei]
PRRACWCRLPRDHLSNNYCIVDTHIDDSPFPGAFPYYSVAQSLYVASRFVPPGNTLKLLSGQRHAFNASQVKGFRTRFAFRCFMTPGVLRATSMLFILKKNHSNATGVKIAFAISSENIDQRSFIRIPRARRTSTSSRKMK